jgi:hypothetical protein
MVYQATKRIRNRERDTVAWLETIKCGENPKGNKEIWELREMS